MFAYTVTCEFDDPAVAEEWIAWLRDEHLADVCVAGAIDAEVIGIDHDATSESKVKCEVRYHFTDRTAFTAYEHDHAPRLRAEGLKRFPATRGVKYLRSTGEVLVQRQR